MNGKAILYIDQYGNKIWAKTVKALRQQVGGGCCRVSKIYQSDTKGNDFHVGYVVGDRWFHGFVSMENAR